MHCTQKALFTRAEKLTLLVFGDVNYHSSADLSTFRSQLVPLSYDVEKAHALCVVRNNKFDPKLRDLLSQIKSFLAKDPHEIKSLAMHLYWLQQKAFPLVCFFRHMRKSPGGFDLKLIAPNITEGTFKKKVIIRIRKKPSSTTD